MARPTRCAMTNGAPPQNSANPAIVVFAASALHCSDWASNCARAYQIQASTEASGPSAAIVQKLTRAARGGGVVTSC